MAWYYGIYSCGHEGRVNIIGKHSERQWKVDRHFEEICEECKAKNREEANRQATKKASEYEFPDLKGTEKQIAWANTIRIDFYEFYISNFSNISFSYTWYSIMYCIKYKLIYGNYTK